MKKIQPTTKKLNNSLPQNPNNKRDKVRVGSYRLLQNVTVKKLSRCRRNGSADKRNWCFCRWQKFSLPYPIRYPPCTLFQLKVLYCLLLPFMCSYTCTSTHIQLHINIIKSEVFFPFHTFILYLCSICLRERNLSA